MSIHYIIKSNLRTALNQKMNCILNIVISFKYSPLKNSGNNLSVKAHKTSFHLFQIHHWDIIL